MILHFALLILCLLISFKFLPHLFSPSCSYMFSVTLPVDSSLAVLRYACVYRPADPHPTAVCTAFNSHPVSLPPLPHLRKERRPLLWLHYHLLFPLLLCHPDVSLKFYYNCFVIMDVLLFYCQCSNLRNLYVPTYVWFKYSCVYHSMKQNVTMSQEATVGPPWSSSLLPPRRCNSHPKFSINGHIAFLSNFFHLCIYCPRLMLRFICRRDRNRILLCSDWFLLFSVMFLRLTQVRVFVVHVRWM